MMAVRSRYFIHKTCYCSCTMSIYIHKTWHCSCTMSIYIFIYSQNLTPFLYHVNIYFHLFTKLDTVPVPCQYIFSFIHKTWHCSCTMLIYIFIYSQNLTLFLYHVNIYSQNLTLFLYHVNIYFNWCSLLLIILIIFRLMLLCMGWTEGINSSCTDPLWIFYVYRWVSYTLALRYLTL